MQVRGEGANKAVAGEKAELRIRVADRFGNELEAGSSAFPYALGLILNPAIGRYMCMPHTSS